MKFNYQTKNIPLTHTCTNKHTLTHTYSQTTPHLQKQTNKKIALVKTRTYTHTIKITHVYKNTHLQTGIIWKGVWRWYHEEMLDCCAKIDIIKQNGITMPQLYRIAKCNQLEADLFYVTPEDDIDEFRLDDFGFSS